MPSVNHSSKLDENLAALLLRVPASAARTTYYVASAMQSHARYIPYFQPLHTFYFSSQHPMFLFLLCGSSHFGMDYPPHLTISLFVCICFTKFFNMPFNKRIKIHIWSASCMEYRYRYRMSFTMWWSEWYLEVYWNEPQCLSDVSIEILLNVFLLLSGVLLSFLLPTAAL